MQTRNPVLDDIARLFSGAVGVAAGMRGEVEAQFRQQMEKLLAQMDLVPREEFEVVRAMAVKAREEQEVLSEKLAALEKELEALRPATPKAAAPKATAAKPARPRGEAKASKDTPDDAGEA